jgi:hypothetical protein
MTADWLSRQRHVVARKVVERAAAQTAPEPGPQRRRSVLGREELVHEAGVAGSLLPVAVVFRREPQSSQRLDHRPDQAECTKGIDVPGLPDADERMIEEHGLQLLDLFVGDLFVFGLFAHA